MNFNAAPEMTWFVQTQKSNDICYGESDDFIQINSTFKHWRLTIWSLYMYNLWCIENR